jgi:protein-L-isoaspartate(D-aspartate) O-methyltransferase
MAELDSFQKPREQMATWQIQRRGIFDQRLLEAFRRIPRHLFVPEEYQSMAYEDHPLPIGCGQTISQPYIVALMTSLLELKGTERVLEVGAGSGYQAAILGCLAAEVHSLELHPSLAGAASRRLQELGLANVNIHCGDGGPGWPAAAPYDGILITAAAARPPQPLLEQLAPGGRLILPAGEPGAQRLQRWQHIVGGWEHENLLDVVFVPLRGAYGWSLKDWPESSGDF